MTTRIVRHPAAIKAAREAAAYGLLNFGHAVEAAWKRDAVVRGGHRSFKTDLTKAGTPRVGGTFRRSIHTAAYLDGTRIGGGTADANGQATPDYAAGSGMVVFVGSNSGYGAYVELGTVKMPARPAAVPALLATKVQAPALIAAGARKHVGQ
jgi:murein DD-endopeptidase MepM/ murein hydrolase activator NlpD